MFLCRKDKIPEYWNHVIVNKTLWPEKISFLNFIVNLWANYQSYSWVHWVNIGTASFKSLFLSLNHGYVILTQISKSDLDLFILNCSQSANQNLDDFCLYMQLLLVKKKLQIHFSITSTLLALSFKCIRRRRKKVTLPVIPSNPAILS